MTNVCDFLNDLPPLREVIRAHNLRAEKKLGQNFLLDQNLTDKIARVGGDISTGTVFEIGPGPGGLTRSILRSGAYRLVAIDFDPRAVKALEDLQHAAQKKLQIIHGDALAIDLRTLSQERPFHIIANLPYNIATPLLIGWLKQIREDPVLYASLTLMFQKEVAQRVTAKLGDKQYGRLAVMANWLCDTKLMFDVPRTAFTPPPKVTSSIVRLIPKKISAGEPSFALMEKITAAAFNQRRKMIRSSLKEYLPVLEALALDPSRRAENLSGEEYRAIARGVPL